MNIKVIKTDEDYREAMARLETLFDAPSGTRQGDELEVLGLLIERYEKEYFPIEMPDPIEAIKFRMEQMGYDQDDLADIVGQKNRANEIINRKRKLSIGMIRQLHNHLHIPADVLIQSY